MPTFENQTQYLLQTTGSHSIRGQYSTAGQDTTHSGSSPGGPLPAYNSGPGTPVAGPSSSSLSSTSSSSSTSQASSADFANELIQVRTEPIRVRTQPNGAAGPQVPTEPDVAAAQRLGLPPVRRISWPHDEPRSGFHRCRSWCATSCKQMFNAAKFWESKKKD
ncbi:hypothetical protein D6D21_01826 [Aureobasidium pullulans]|uniref:Uncharacterized protein n=1 Tax=Aureobasidium pullulans TaxID=5580 RepID=A0AB74J9V2_AURPU|nr:hypothetical protein D6D21_01826 [Aureobasidium pullulans]